MEKEKTVDELLDELGWSWLPCVLFFITFLFPLLLVGWLEEW
ncbi:hypothetical protein [Thermaerobacillus caldiproteolyticus]|nr:hypothetical protein [Anoxybacillus caldiproteolyticus]